MAAQMFDGRVYGSGVTEALARVQSILDVHVGASAGRCAVCGPGTCQTYLKASRTFAWSGHLPRRLPAVRGTAPADQSGGGHGGDPLDGPLRGVPVRHGPGLAPAGGQELRVGLTPTRRADRSGVRADLTRTCQLQVALLTSRQVV